MRQDDVRMMSSILYTYLYIYCGQSTLRGSEVTSVIIAYKTLGESLRNT